MGGEEIVDITKRYKAVQWAANGSVDNHFDVKDVAVEMTDTSVDIKKNNNNAIFTNENRKNGDDYVGNVEY